MSQANLGSDDTIRPKPVLIATGLLAFNAICCAVWWLVFPEAIVSNGTQVFFVVLWIALAWYVFVGANYVRFGLAVLTLAFAGNVINAASLADGWFLQTGDDQITKVVTVVVLALLFLPVSNTWFSAVRTLAREDEATRRARHDQ